MREYIERGRDGRWYAVRESERMSFDTTGPVRVRRRIPVPPDAGPERVRFVAVQMGLVSRRNGK